MSTAEQQEPLHFLDYWHVIQSRKEVVIAVFLLVVATGILVTYAMPKFYRASCVISVEEETPDVDLFTRKVSGFNPFFLRTQHEIIQSRPIIEEAVRTLGLDKRLAKAYGFDMLSDDRILDRACAVLDRRMRVQQFRDTNLIEIRIDMAEPLETVRFDVAAVANTIAAVYRARNVNQFNETKGRALIALDDALDEQRKKVYALETRVEEIREQYKIDLIASYPGATLDKTSLVRMEELRIMAMLELEDKKARWEKIGTLSGDELRDVGPRLVGDPALQQLVAMQRKMQVELGALREGMLGPRHPDVVHAETALKELSDRIDDALNALRISVQADYEASVAKVKALTDEMEQKRASERSAEAGGYRVFDKAREELAHARKIRDALEMRAIEEKLVLRMPRTSIEVVEQAAVPAEEDFVTPNLLLNILLSVTMGLAAGMGLAFFIEYVDTSLKTVEEVERFMAVSVIGVIPQKVRPFVERGADLRHAEPYRVLRANIQFSEKMKDAKTVCVTSGSVGEGKSLTVFNLGYVCAQLGDRTIIVDSDLHRPRQHKILGHSNRTGLANVLVGEIGLDDAIAKTPVNGLDFLPSGKSASGVHGLLDTARMRELVKELRARYDVILFDAPPMIGVSDASILAREVDGVLLVVQHRKYPRTVSRRAKEMVENVGGNLVGVVLNNINVSRDYSYYYHHYYYSYAKAGSPVGNGGERA